MPHFHHRRNKNDPSLIADYLIKGRRGIAANLWLVKL